MTDLRQDIQSVLQVVLKDFPSWCVKEYHEPGLTTLKITVFDSKGATQDIEIPLECWEELDRHIVLTKVADYAKILVESLK